MAAVFKKREVSYEARGRSRTVMIFVGHTMKDRAEQFARERNLQLVRVTKTETIIEAQA